MSFPSCSPSQRHTPINTETHAHNDSQHTYCMLTINSSIHTQMEKDRQSWNQLILFLDVCQNMLWIQMAVGAAVTGSQTDSWAAVYLSECLVLCGTSQLPKRFSLKGNTVAHHIKPPETRLFVPLWRHNRKVLQQRYLILFSWTY